MLTATPTRPSPCLRASHEDAAVGGEDSPEVRVGLKRRHEPVETKRENACTDPGQTTVLTDALPDQPCPADLGESGE